MATELDGVKTLAVSGSNVSTFNKNNKWVSAGIVDNITTESILSSGFEYNILSTSLTDIYLNYLSLGNLTDGTNLYQSESIIYTMNPTYLETVYDETDSVYKLKVTIPAFLPKDSLSSDVKYYCYTENTNFNPYIESLTFDNVSIHANSTGLKIKVVYNYNEKIKYRIKINDGEWSDWSGEYNPYDDLLGSIAASSLRDGGNNVTVEVATIDELKTTTKTYENAITLTNENPQLAIITSESDSFKVKFSIMDNDVTDTIKYKLYMTNSLYSKLQLQDWTDYPTDGSLPVYYIDTSKIVVNEDNIINIEYTDGHIAENKVGSYTFTGKYSNLVFLDENGAYYTSDRGVVLKVLDINGMIAGSQSDTYKITLRNDSDSSITNLTISTIETVPINGACVKYSKSNNPFTPSDSLDYGDQVFNIGDTLDFYVKVDSTIESSGVYVFDIYANSTPQ